MVCLTAARADLALAEHDPAIGEMAAIFDPVALLDSLAPHWPVAGAELRYLRYKPGMSLTATVELRLPDGRLRPVQAAALAAPALVKLDKVVRAGNADDVGLGAVVDRRRGLVLADATADRALPGVRHYLRRTDPSTVTPLVYKPARRWVARHDPPGAASSVVKVHPPAVAPALLDRHRALLAGGLPVAPLAPGRSRRGVLATVLVPGLPLDELEAERDRWPAGRTAADASREVGGGEDGSREGAPSESEPGETLGELWQRAGELLAELHRGPVPGGLPRVQRDGELTAAVAAIRAVVPELADRARRVAELVRAGLGGRQLLRVVHGDFSADQLVVRPDLTGAGAEPGSGPNDGQGVGPDTDRGSAVARTDRAPLTLVDLDRVGVDDPLADLGSWHAAEVVAGRAAADADPVKALGPLLAGYLRGGGQVDERALRLQASGALLRRAVEPFRFRTDDWPTRVEALVAAAHGLARR